MPANAPSVNVSQKLRSPAAAPQAIFYLDLDRHPVMPLFAMALVVHVHKRLSRMGPIIL